MLQSLRPSANILISRPYRRNVVAQAAMAQQQPGMVQGRVPAHDEL